MVILDLVNSTIQHTKYLLDRRIVVHADNKKVPSSITLISLISSQFSSDRCSKITNIRELINKTNMRVKFMHAKMRIYFDPGKN